VVQEHDLGEHTILMLSGRQLDLREQRPRPALGHQTWPGAAVGLHREALGIGTLMNARGLMELIIINIGLQRGIISPALFATLVIMAIVTTLMASPMFERLVGTGTYQPITELELGT